MNCVVGLALLVCSILCAECFLQLDNTPPIIVTNFKTKYYMARGNTSRLDINCHANANPSPTYKWFRNDVELYDQQKHRIFPNGTMIIKDPDIRTTFGTYYCVAENKYGVSLSKKFEILMADLLGFPLNQADATVNVVEYKPAVILCNNQPPCEPKHMCKYEWKKGDSTEDGVIPDERIAVDNDGTLHFLYTLRTDETSSQTKLSCGIYNTKLNTFVAGSKTVLQVSTAFDPSYQAPSVRSSKDVTVLRGQRAELQCIIAGYPAVTIQWTGPDGRGIDLSSSDYEFGVFRDNKINMRTLIVKKAMLQHEGEYRCVGSNTDTLSGNPKRIETKINLNVTGPPEFTEQMKDQVVPVGNNAVFKCKTRSMPKENPPERPVWRINGQLVTEVQQKYTLSPDGTELTVNKVEKSDTSNIQCSVRNAPDVEYTTYADVILAVIDPMTVIASPPKSIKVMPGEVHSVYVEAEGDPQFSMEYNWNFTKDGGDKVLTDANFLPEMILLDNKRNLTLDASALEGSAVRELVGLYMVQVGYTYDHRYFVVNVTTDMTVPTLPVTEVESAGFDYWIIAVILGIIFVIIVIFLIVCMIRYNRGGDYPVDKKELAAGHDPERELKDSGFHDLSRADGIDDDKLDMDRMSLNASLKGYESDEDDLREYGGELDTSKFNEDGSFIGLYVESNKAPSQSTV